MTRPIRIFDPGAAWRPMIGDVHAALEAFIHDGVFIDGDAVARFERAVAARIGLAHAVGCGSGTNAIQLALMANGIGRGDEVITVANTYYATARAIRAAGATPVFVEIDTRTAQIDPRAAADAITPRTAALLAVHLYGWPAPSDALRALADRRGIALIEDVAHGFGGGVAGCGLGATADVACFSFYPTKTLGALGDAGMLVTPHADVAARARRLRYFADATRTAFEPDALHTKLDALQATLLQLRLARIDDDRARRIERAAIYRAAFAPAGLDIPVVDEPIACPYVFPLRVADRERFLAELRTAAVHAGVHYPTDLHTRPEFGGAAPGRLPATERHNARVVSLPVYAELPLDDVHRVVDAVLAAERDTTVNR